MNKKKLLKKIKYGLRFLPDKTYLQIYYFLRLKKFCNFKHPKTFNEKLNWLKVNDHNPLYTKLVDKCGVKEYVAELIGEEYVVPTLGIWDSFDEIDFDKLPNQFVLKCTHDSEGLVICKDKSKLNRAEAKAKIEAALKFNFYYIGREWPYKNVKPRIIAEKFMVDETGWDLKDYKIFCFNGKPVYIEVDYNRSVKHMLNAYDLNWNFLDFCDKSPNNKDADIPKPQRLDDMLKIAEKLSEGFTFLRVDMYSIYDRIYCGELTLYPGSGFIQFNPPETDAELGKRLRLPIDNR